MKTRISVFSRLVMAFLLCFSLVSCGESKKQKRLESENVVAEGEFEEGVRLFVNEIKPEEGRYQELISKVSDKVYDKEKAVLFDISLLKDDSKVQPDSMVRITMPVPFEAEKGYVTYHIKDEMTKELKTSFSNGKISFETESFSYFLVAGKIIDPSPIIPDVPSPNFFAYADTIEQGILIANGTDVSESGYSNTLEAGDKVELSARAKDGYEMLGWYKDTKKSGNNERYEEKSNPATFTYLGSEKMHVYARFDAISYNIHVNLNGGEFRPGEEIPETYTVETDTIVLSTPIKGTTEFLGWVDDGNETVTEIKKGTTGDIHLTAKWNEPVYIRVDRKGNPDENGEYVLFGNYPQTAVKSFETAKLLALEQLAGELPQNGNNGKWTSYRYHYAKLLSDDPALPETVMSNEVDFMWYIDVDYDQNRYRGVYFTHYRPSTPKGTYNLLVDDTSSESRPQKNNRYFVGKIYWFQYEPVLWKIIRNKDGMAQLLCMSTLDSQAYTLLLEKSKQRMKDDLDEHYVYYNAMDGVPEETLATDYEYSSIRTWLNEVFYNTAFCDSEKASVLETIIDNVSCEVGKNTKEKVFLPSVDDIKDQDDLYRKATDYSQVQGVEADYSKTYASKWYVRESYYILKYSDKKNLISYDSDRYKWLCSVSGGSFYDSISKKPGFTGVSSIQNGVVPSLWMTL